MRTVRATEKTIALPHASLLDVSRETGRDMDDPWCARLAALHLLHVVETGEDMEKDLVTVMPADLKRYAGESRARGRIRNARRVIRSFEIGVPHPIFHEMFTLL
jgi:hypothetical protein